MIMLNKMLDPIGPELQLTDFYHPSDDQQARAIVFIVLALGAAGVAVTIQKSRLKA